MNTKFDLNVMLSTPAVLQHTIKQIPCNMLVPYHNHKFSLYTGEQLEDMVQSIKKNGVLCPIVVQSVKNGYEILIGHNRWKASQLAGLTTIPAIIKEGLSESEAEMYVTESNIIQRGFNNLKISEQASVIAQRHNSMFSQGKRNDIIRELKMLENPDSNDLQKDSLTLNPLGSKLDSNKETGAEYGLGKTSVIRLIRINKLIDKLKDLVDNGNIAVRSAVELSFLSESAQMSIAKAIDNGKIDMKKAKKLRDSADENGNVDDDTIIQIISETVDIKSQFKSVKISNDVFKKYFKNNIKSDKVTETLEKALTFYFESLKK